MQHRGEAAAKVLTQAEAAAIQRAELAWIFESLRAAVHVLFDFHSMLRILWGFSNPQQAASVQCDFPDFQKLQGLQNAFQLAETYPSDQLRCLDVLLLLVELKEHSQWPLGIVYVCSHQKSADVIYLGVPSAKLVLLVRQAPQAAVDVWVAGASAYRTGMNTTVAVRMLRPLSVPSELMLSGEREVTVEVRGDCSKISLLGHHCATHHCPLCILLQFGLCMYCPWHLTAHGESHSCIHIFCEVTNTGRGLCVTGHLGRISGHVDLVLCHVTQGLGDLNSIHGFSEWKNHAQLDWVLPLLPNAAPVQTHSQTLSGPFASSGLTSSYYEHFFVLPCDKNARISSLLVEWGCCVRDDG